MGNRPAAHQPGVRFAPLVRQRRRAGHTTGPRDARRTHKRRTQKRRTQKRRTQKRRTQKRRTHKRRTHKRRRRPPAESVRGGAAVFAVAATVTLVTGVTIERGGEQFFS